MPRNGRKIPVTPLITAPMVGPGFRGLHTELPFGIGYTVPEWATVFDNWVLDDQGIPTSRQGYQTLTKDTGFVEPPPVDPSIATAFVEGGVWSRFSPLAPEAAGTNRILVVTHSVNTSFPAFLTWGNQAMTQLGTLFVSNGLNMTVSYLLEADIAANTGTEAITASSSSGSVQNGGGSFFWLTDAPQEAPEGLTLQSLASGATQETSLIWPPTAPEGVGVSTENAVVLTSIETAGNILAEDAVWTPPQTLIEAPPTGVNGGAAWHAVQGTDNGQYDYVGGNQPFQPVVIAQISVRGPEPPPTLPPPPGADTSFYHLHEYLRRDGTVSVIGVTDDFNIWESVDDGCTFNNITGDLTGVLRNLDLQFANLDGDLFIGASGHRVHQFNDTLGVFTEIEESPVSSGSLIGTFGRLWNAVDGLNTVAYSGLLDGTDWTSASAGGLDASNAWTNVFDNITALASFGATFIIFGREHVLLYVDSEGTELGVDPNNLYVVDTIEGTGCTQRDSIVNIGDGDLWYLGPQGIQSLQRLVADKVNPLVDLSRNQRSLVLDFVNKSTGSPASVRAVYSPEERFVLYSFPELNKVLAYDTRFPMEEGTWRASTWTTHVPYTGLLVRRNNDIILGIPEGSVAKYEGNRDDIGGDEAVITATIRTPVLNYGTEQHNQNKILKEFYLRVSGGDGVQGKARWATDFQIFSYHQEWSSPFCPVPVTEWAEDEFGIGEFTTNIGIRTVDIAAAGEGQTLQFQTTMLSPTVAEPVKLIELGIRAKAGSDSR